MIQSATHKAVIMPGPEHSVAGRFPRGARAACRARHRSARQCPGPRALGNGIEGRDVRLAIRHPQALEHILVQPLRRYRRDRDRGDRPVVAAEHAPARGPCRAGPDDRPLGRGLGREDAGRFRRQCQPRVADAPFGGPRLCRNPGRGGRPPAELLVALRSTIRDEARRMLRIIEDLMSLSRIEAERFLAPDETSRSTKSSRAPSPTPESRRRPRLRLSSIFRPICRRSAATARN